MEQETILKEILNALNEHSKQLNDKMDAGFAKVDARFEEVDRRFDEVDRKIDHLNKKFDGQRIELYETQETSNFAASKVIQHEKKLRQICAQ